MKIQDQDWKDLEIRYQMVLGEAETIKEVSLKISALVGIESTMIHINRFTDHVRQMVFKHPTFGLFVVTVCCDIKNRQESIA